MGKKPTIILSITLVVFEAKHQIAKTMESLVGQNVRNTKIKIQIPRMYFVGSGFRQEYIFKTLPTACLY